MDREPYQCSTSPDGIAFSQYLAARYGRGRPACGPFPLSKVITNRACDDEDLSYRDFHTGRLGPGRHFLAMARPLIFLLHHSAYHWGMPGLLWQFTFSCAHRANPHPIGFWGYLVVDMSRERDVAIGDQKDLLQW